MISTRTALLLLFIFVIAILASGCVEQSDEKNANHPENQITQSPTPTASVTQVTYERLRQKVIPQPNGSRADYIKMLKDIYVQGEDVKLTVVNDGSEKIECPNQWPDFYVYHQFENGTSIWVKRSQEIVMPAISYIMPGQAFGYQFSTKDLEPGRYRIVVDCGEITREFLIQDPRSLTATPNLG
jgi:hypothetical protein